MGALLDRHPGTRVDVVEPSAGMIARSRRTLPGGAPVTFHRSRLEDTAPDPEAYDLVAAHFFLDCFDPAGQRGQIAIIDRALRPGGTLLIADFQMPPSGALARLRARTLLWTMYRFFHLATGLETDRLSDPDPALEAVHLQLVKRQVTNAGFLRSDMWQKPEARASPSPPEGGTPPPP